MGFCKAWALVWAASYCGIRSLEFPRAPVLFDRAYLVGKSKNFVLAIHVWSILESSNFLWVRLLKKRVQVWGKGLCNVLEGQAFLPCDFRPRGVWVLLRKAIRNPKFLNPRVFV